MSGIAARVVVACLLVSEVCPAQQKPTLPDAPPRWVDADDVEGVAVRCIDATTGGQIDGGRAVRVGQPLAAHRDGSLPLGRGTHWFEAEAPGYTKRRTRTQLSPEQRRGAIEIPLFPEFTFVVGRVDGGDRCTVAVPDEVPAVAGFFTPRAACDAKGRFELRVHALPEPLALEVRVGARVAATLQVVAPKVARVADAGGEHRGIAAIDCGTLPFTPSPAQLTFLAKYVRRASAAAEFERASGEIAVAIDAATAWLVAHQDASGGWDCDGFMAHDPKDDRCDGPGDDLHDVGVTGLAMLALLADGEYPAGPLAPAVTRAVAWLRAEQDAASGLIGTQASHHFIYDHLLGTLALCEALAFAEEPAVRTACERAVRFVLDHRHPDHMWRYDPRSPQADVSITGWAVQALTTARDAGIAVPDEVLVGAARYFDSLTDEVGRTGYMERGGLSSRHKGDHEMRFPADRFEPMTAVAVFARALLRGAGVDATTPAASLALLGRKPPVWRADSIDEYGWMLAAHAIAHTDVDARVVWRKALASAVLPAQNAGSARRGSWDPVGVWGLDCGRVGTTAMLALALQAPYRYAPLP